MQVPWHAQSALALESAFALRHGMLVTAVDALLRGRDPPVDDIDVVLDFQLRLHPSEAAVLHGLAVPGLLPPGKVLVLEYVGAVTPTLLITLGFSAMFRLW